MQVDHVSLLAVAVQEKDQQLLGLKQEVLPLNEELKQLQQPLRTIKISQGIFPIDFHVPYSKEKQNAQNYSLDFYTHPQGYRMRIKVVPIGKDAEETSLHVYRSFFRGDYDDRLKWPFLGKVIIQLINQVEDDNHKEVLIEYTKKTDAKYSDLGKLKTNRKSTEGLGKVLAHHSDLWDDDSEARTQYVKENCITIHIFDVCFSSM